MTIILNLKILNCVKLFIVMMISKRFCAMNYENEPNEISKYLQNFNMINKIFKRSKEIQMFMRQRKESSSFGSS